VIFREAPLPGVWVLELERHADERGFFARTFCRQELEAHGLAPEVAQCNLSVSHRRGTLRGLHLQRAPHEEAKLVRCTRGSLFDVAVDLRAGSATFARWFGVVLSAERANQLYVPKGFAHGFLTLEDDTEVCYQMSTPYAPEHQAGYRWDDPAFGIEWPAEVRVISERDRNLPALGAHVEPPSGGDRDQAAREPTR
jgi:dTDP-4-dehydrorhamnose 3,5-epimerase